MENIVFNIQRFCVKDGPGIRTTVFLKGCPLNCEWCHNPESKTKEKQIAFNIDRCISCGKCVNVCTQNAILQIGVLQREKCNLCGKCVEDCVGALEVWGQEITCEQVFNEVLLDKDFYNNSGGGLTISGGEPLYNIDFTLQLLTMAKQYGINTCVETCGFSKWQNLEKIMPFVDLFLYDIKETDVLLHKKHTGVDNKLILENLFKLDKFGAKIVLRCPIIPSCNDREEHFKAIGELANNLNGVTHIEVMPYHPLGKSKSQQLGMDYKVKGTFTSEEQIQNWINRIGLYTNKKVIKN